MRWSDGSLQLLIGNEVLDISVQDAQHDQAHLFLRHEKVWFLFSCKIQLQFYFYYVNSIGFHDCFGREYFSRRGEC